MPCNAVGAEASDIPAMTAVWIGSHQHQILYLAGHPFVALLSNADFFVSYRLKPCQRHETFLRRLLISSPLFQRRSLDEVLSLRTALTVCGIGR